MQNSLVSTAYAPPFRIVIKYFTAGILSFLIFNAFLVLNSAGFHGHHFQPKILAITHIATLGWISMIIFGALFQMIPVVLQVKLYSEILAEIQFWIFSLGVFTLVFSFWNFTIGLPLTIGASLINISVIIFLVNAIVSLAKVKEWNLTASYLAAALFYLLTTAAAGLLLAINLGFPYINTNHLDFIKYHMIIAVVGWVGMVIMGVSLKLIPMFTLAHDFSTMPGKIAFGLINCGLMGFIVELHIPGAGYLFIASAAAISLGIYFFIYQVFLIFRCRIRKKLDAAMKFSFTSYVFFGIAVIYGLLLFLPGISSLPNITLAFGYIIFTGFISMLITGQMYKILPFLTWYHKYSSKAGIQKVPMLRDMYDETLADLNYWLMLSACTGAPVFIVLNITPLVFLSFVVMLISASLFVFNMINILVI